MYYFDELFTNLPTEDTRIVFFVLFNLFLYFGGGHTGFRTSDHSGSDGPGFLVAIQYFGNTAMTDS